MTLNVRVVSLMFVQVRRFPPPSGPSDHGSGGARTAEWPVSFTKVLRVDGEDGVMGSGQSLWGHRRARGDEGSQRSLKLAQSWGGPRVGFVSGKYDHVRGDVQRGAVACSALVAGGSLLIRMLSLDPTRIAAVCNVPSPRMTNFLCKQRRGIHLWLVAELVSHTEQSLPKVKSCSPRVRDS